MDENDPVKIRKLWIAGDDKKTRSISIPIDLHYWWQRRYRSETGPKRINYLRIVVKEDQVECHPMTDWKKPSGDLNEFVVSVTATGRNKDYGKFAFPRRLLNYLYIENPDLKEIRIILKDGWFLIEPV